ncbi:MAG TPA: hypothetical protein VF450_00575 [Noviherbaspirillum sp.]|jgi:hypothetical protein
MDDPPMTLDEYINQEVRLTKQERKPNAISLRFVELHELQSRSAAEEEEYQVLHSLMRSRWRWFDASSEVVRKRKTAKR